MKSKAIVAVDTRKVKIQEIEIGDVREWDICVQLENSAISVGTESYLLKTQKKENGPMITGYAPVGRVIEAGKKAAKSFPVGSRASYFGPRCPEGFRQLCGGQQRTGIIDVNPEGRDMLAPDGYRVTIPEDIPFERAAFAGISSVSGQGVSLSKPEVGDKALVIGQGMIGQFAAQHYRLRGCEVAVADLHRKRLDLSAQSGADHTINCSKESLAKAVLAIWPNGADIIADSTGNYDVIEESIAAARYRGKYVFLAWCKGNNFDLPRLHNHIFEAYFPWTLQGHRVLHAWRLMQNDTLKIDHLTTHRFHYTQAQEAFDLIYDAPEEYAGILFDWKE
jgi:2-desacetyl-2-hydroxyethyl bacteriochlorophyllide A dehydrogenase